MDVDEVVLPNFQTALMCSFYDKLPEENKKRVTVADFQRYYASLGRPKTLTDQLLVHAIAQIDWDYFANYIKPVSTSDEVIEVNDETAEKGNII